MMTRSLNLVLSSILITLIVLGLSSPVVAQPPTLPHLPRIYVNAPSFVTVSTEFDIIISIRDIPDGWGMIHFIISAQWDSNDLEYIECEFLGSGRLGTWDGDCGTLGLPDSAGAEGDGPRWTEDAAWFRIRFHCLREGPAPITVSTDPPPTSAIDNLDEATTHSITLEDLSGQNGLVAVDADPVTVIVNQVEPAPVGGVASPINKLEILTPYLALAGLIAAVSAVYVIKKRKD